MMNTIKSICFISMLLVFAASCTKKEEIIIPGNVAPPDQTIPSVIIENYVTKTYISVLGRKPNTTEFNDGVSSLKQTSLSAAGKSAFLDGILGKPEYNINLYKINSYDILNRFDTTEISVAILSLNNLLGNPAYAPFYDQINFEKGRLELLKVIPQDLSSGNLTVRGLHKRLINNYLYDQLNMGSENFVISVFDQFYFRQPSMTEFGESVKMVNGFSGVVFFQLGTTKEQFIDIALNSDNYYEGQARTLFIKYLFREPNSEEMSAFAARYKSSQNYKALQKEILSLKEYVGY